MKTAELASAPPETWNKKNLPSDIERFEETTPGVRGFIQKLPSTAKDLVQRRPGLVALSVAALAGCVLAWYFARRD
jgi:hypothetical protein